MIDPKPTRRGALGLAMAAAASPLLPSNHFGDAGFFPPGAPPPPLLPAWQVGQEDEMNWRVYFAETADRAMQLFRAEVGLCDGCDGCDGLRCAELDREGECAFAGLQALKASEQVIAPAETEGEHDLTDEEVNRLGWRHHCDRHEDVCDEWNIVARDGKREIVCNDCMSLADWEIVDPDYARDLREEAEA